MATDLELASSDSHRRAPLRPLRPRDPLRKFQLQRTRARSAVSNIPQPNPSEAHDHGWDQQVVELLPVVKWMALKIHKRLPGHIEVDDLIGAGSLGLVDALRKFDARKRVKIATYARHRIRGAILDSLRDSDSASRDMRKKNKKVERVYRHLEAKLGHPVGDAELARELGVSLEEWYRTVQQLQAVIPDWLRPVGSGRPKQIVEENLVGDSQENPFDRCYRLEQQEIVRRALAGLPGRERLVMSLYYHQALTMKQIAGKLGADESRVSQLHSAALVRLRKRVNAILRRPILRFTSNNAPARAGAV